MITRHGNYEIVGTPFLRRISYAIEMTLVIEMLNRYSNFQGDNPLFPVSTSSPQAPVVVCPALLFGSGEILSLFVAEHLP